MITGSPTPAGLSEFLKKVLHEQDVDFIVAPYSALAQVSHSPTVFCGRSVNLACIF